MNKRKFFEKGFTLVELLIVIALIAILSVAVLATINPIEQSNKARDAAQKNDAAEVLGAYERYYTSANSYPWGAPGVGGVGATSIISTNLGFGVAGTGGTGVLITTSELKSSFAAKAPFNGTPAMVDLMYVYNNGSDSNYVCYIPKAQANRSKYGDLRCLTGSTLLSPGMTGCVSITSTSAKWNTDGALTGGYFGSGNAEFMCVPESATVVGVIPVP